MATPDDILTVQKNGVIAINNLSQVTKYLAGTATAGGISSQTTVVPSGSGRVARVAVIVAGTTAGTVYSGSGTSSTAIAPLPNTIGVYEIGAIFSGSLSVTPGSGQTISITYSLD